MDIQLAKEIVACLPRGRTLFRYYPGRFAFLLLASVARRYATVAELKASPFARLLQREDVKQFLSDCGDGKLCRAQLQQVWQELSYCFRLSLGGWVGKPTHPPEKAKLKISSETEAVSYKTPMSSRASSIAPHSFSAASTSWSSVAIKGGAKST